MKAARIEADIHSFLGFLESKESQFTVMIGTLLIGVLLSLLTPFIFRSRGSIPGVFWLGFWYSVLYFALAVLYLRWISKHKVLARISIAISASIALVVLLSSFAAIPYETATIAFLGNVYMTPFADCLRGMTPGYFAWLLILFAVLMATAFGQFKRYYYRKLHDQAWKILDELHEYPESQEFCTVDIRHVVFTRYRDKIHDDLPWPQRKITFMISGPGVRDEYLEAVSGRVDTELTG